MTPNARGHDFEAIRVQCPLLEEAQKFVKLTKAGQEWKGLCPFHKETTPSFMVNPAKGKFKCHGCGVNGDVIDFTAERLRCSKTEAIAHLTDGKVVALPEPVRRERDALREAAERAEAERKERGSDDATRRYERATTLDRGHPYLVRKDIAELAFDLSLARCEGASLLIPMNDGEGDLQSVQAISPDGDKKFHAGAPSKGARLMIGLNWGGRTIVCEGWATGLSIFMATAEQVCVTFSAGNMDVVARDLVERGFSVMLAPDRDQVPHFTEMGAELGVPVIGPRLDGSKVDFNDEHIALGLDHVRQTFADGLREYTLKAERERKAEERENAPLDLWQRTPVPLFPEALLPPLIARFAKVRADMVGCDPSGVAVAAIATCGALISDKIKLRMKRHDEHWKESARLWVMLVGSPSTKKSPIFSAVTRRLAQIDMDLIVSHSREMQDWLEGGKNGTPPVPKRLRVQDITMEKVAEVCAHNPDGILSYQDELSGWFGSIEKYGGGKGGAKDRSFWLQTYNGGHYAVDRIGRKAEFVENLSVSMIGGVQPEPIRRIIHDASDDGLIQRFLPIMLGNPVLGKDIEMPDVAAEYDALQDRLHALQAPTNWLGCLVFSDEAQALRNDLEATHLAMMTSFEGVNRKVASHIGKYDGIFGRLCVIFHCIEHATECPETALGDVIGVSTAQRAADFLHRFLRRHAMAFYTNVAGLSDDHDILTDIAGYIIAHKLDRVSLRTLGRGTRAMRKMTNFEGNAILEQMVAHGWLEEDSKRSDARAWKVNPVVHDMYAERAEDERTRREVARRVVAEILEG